MMENKEEVSSAEEAAMKVQNLRVSAAKEAAELRHRAEVLRDKVADLEAAAQQWDTIANSGPEVAGKDSPLNRAMKTEGYGLRSEH